MESSVRTATIKPNGSSLTESNFDVLISTVHTSFAEVHSATHDLLEFKDELLTHHLPPSLLVRVTCLFARFYRAFSDLNPPVNELLRLTKLYASPWNKQTAVMQRLYRENEQKRGLLNVAIRRLAIAERRSKGWEQEQRVLNWERLYLRLSEAKGFARRWRFRVDGIRKKADQGYDELVRWINARDGYIEVDEEEDDQYAADMDEMNGASHIDREDDIEFEEAEDSNEPKEPREQRERKRISEIQRRKEKLMGGSRKKRIRERYDDDLSNLSLDLDAKSELSDDEKANKAGRKKSAGLGANGDDVNIRIFLKKLSFCKNMKI